MVIARREPFGDSPIVGGRGATTQRRILEAALEVFGEHGFHDTKVELITEVAGCSRPSFYQYFESKEDVFWRLADDLMSAMDELASRVSDTTPDPEGVAHIRHWLDELIDLHEQFAPIFVVFPTAARGRTQVKQSSRNAGVRIGSKLIPRASGLSPRATRSADAVASLTFTIVLRTIHYFRLGLGQLSRDRFITGLAQTLHRLQFGSIEGVNVGSLSKPPSKRVQPWPHFPTDDQPAARDRGRQTRNQLLSAATTVLPNRGYHDTRVDDIVETAGLSHGTFYRYFTSKDDLFRVLAQQAAMAMVDLVSSFPEGAPAEGLHDWLTEWFESYRDNGGVISTWQEINYDEPELATFSLEIAIGVFDRLQRIVHARGFGDSVTDALALLAVVERAPFISQSLKHLDPDDAIGAAVLFIRRGLFGLDLT